MKLPSISLCLLSTAPRLAAGWDFLSSLSPLRVPAEGSSQAPIMPLPLPNILLPGSSQDGGDDDNVSGGLIISDVLGRERSINMFAGFIRGIESISRRLEDKNQNSTILAPLNSRIQQLPRKPWESPQEYAALGEQAYEGSGGEDRAQRNLRKFVEAHLVPQSPWVEGDRRKTVAGNEVWWESKDDKKFIQPGDIEVMSVASKVSNGDLWIIKGVLNSSQ